MLKETQRKITPVEVPEWYQKAILEEMTPWYVRVELRTWVLLGVLGFLVLFGFFVVLMPFNPEKEQKALDTLIQESTRNQQQEVGVTPLNRPAQDEPTMRWSGASMPPKAAVYVDADSVGLASPVSYTLKPDVWPLSLKFPHFVSLDSVLFLMDRTGLHFSLNAAEPLPIVRVMYYASRGKSRSQQTAATPSKPAISEEPAVAYREAPAKTILDTAVREPGHQEVPGTIDPPDAAFSQTAVALSERSTHEAPRTKADRGDDAASDTPPSALPPPAQAPADSSERPTNETPQTETGRGGDVTNTASVTSLSALPPETLAQALANPTELPTVETSQTETDCSCDVTNAASEAQNEPTGASNSQYHNTPSRRSPKTPVRGRGKKVNILEVKGKRTLELGQEANLTLVTSTDITSSAVFLWESEDGVFAIGRSINISFSKAGVYTITVTAKNDYGVDKKNLKITVKELPRKTPEKEG